MNQYLINRRTIRRSIFVALIRPIFSTIIGGFIYFWAVKHDNFVDWTIENKAWPLILFIYGFLSIPALLILIEYILININKTIVINNNSITIISKHFTLENSFEHIERCILFRETNSLKFVPASRFSFAVIKFKDGTTNIITCLMEWDLKNVLNGIDYEEKRMIFPSVVFFKLFYAI